MKRAGAPRGTGPPTIYDLWMSGQQAQRLPPLVAVVLAVASSFVVVDLVVASSFCQ